jgi:hypothetical protein
MPGFPPARELDWITASFAGMVLEYNELMLAKVQ